MFFNPDNSLVINRFCWSLVILPLTFSVEKKPNVGPKQNSCQNNGPLLQAYARHPNFD